MKEAGGEFTLEVKRGDELVFAFEEGGNALLTQDAELNSQVREHLGAAQQWLKESSTQPTE